MKSQYYLLSGEEAEVISVDRDAKGQWVLEYKGRTYEIDAILERHRVHLLVNHKSYECELCACRDAYRVSIGRYRYDFPIVDERHYRQWKSRGQNHELEEADLRSPMSGRVVKIMVQEGDEVEKGEVAIIVEAMKMENDLKIPQSGKVQSIPVKVGDQVDIGDMLIKVEPFED